MADHKITANDDAGIAGDVAMGNDVANTAVAAGGNIDKPMTYEHCDVGGEDAISTVDQNPGYSYCHASESNTATNSVASKESCTAFVAVKPGSVLSLARISPPLY